MWPRRPAGIVFCLMAMIATMYGSWACNRPAFWGKAETIILGAPALEQNALIYIANEQQFFARNGLNVVFRDYDSGVTAIDGLLKGEVDIAEAAEFPFVTTVFQTNQVKVIAVNDKFENDYVVARKDRGIGAIADLKGKRIGVARRSINEYYLGRFLDLNGMRLQDVTVVDVRPAQFVDAFASDNLDAIVAWQPHVDQMVEKQGEKNVVVWPAQSRQAAFGVLIAKSQWIVAQRATVERFLKSLAEAEGYLTRNPDKSRTVVQNWLGYSDAYVASVWPRHQFFLSLDFSLLVAMNDEARWLMDNNLTPERQAPDFYGNVYTDGLRAVKPEAANLAR